MSGASAGGSGDDNSSEDADFNFQSYVGSRRYPIHDCCEFEDAESLRRLVFVTQDDSDSSSSDGSSSYSSSEEEKADSMDRSQNRTPVVGEHDTLPESSAITDQASQTEVNAKTEAVKDMEKTEGQRNGEASPEAQQTSMDSDALPKQDDLNVKEKEKDTAKNSSEGNGNEVKQPNDTESDDHPTNGGMLESSLPSNEQKPAEDSNMIVTEECVPKEASVTITQMISSSSTQITSMVVQHTETTASDSNISVTQSQTITSQQEEIMQADLPADANKDAEQMVSVKASEQCANTEEMGDLKQSEASSILDAVLPAASGGGGPTAIQESSQPDQAPTSEKKRRKPRYYCPYDLNERDEDENTPLHIAIHCRKLDCVRLLLEAGANIHKKSDGSAPVHLAISIGAIPAHQNFAAECLALLKSHGADLSAKDDSMHTPLYLACISNAPRCAAVILTDPVGLTTLNLRADRIGGRPLHACAKFDMRPRGSGPATAHHRGIRAHHAHRSPIIPTNSATATNAMNGAGNAVLTRMLISTSGIEVDPTNNYGRTPLHIAAANGNWPVARLLIEAGANPNAVDRRGYTPGKLATKRGMVVPNDLVEQLGHGAAMPLAGGDTTGACRDLIMDPDASTILLCHEICSRHRSCPPITRGGIAADPPPENVRRLHVLINEEVGILRSVEFLGCHWETEARRAAISDVLKVHEYAYVEKISQLCLSIPDHASAIASLDPDTAVSRWSFEAAMRAAGSVCEAVDKIMAGDYRNSFCAIRPPGHHAGFRGVVTCPNDPDGSHGFCLLNNVAIGAAYARSMYRNDGIRKVAIVDFDVHHGNGTEEIVRNLVPNIDTSTVRTPFAIGTLQTSKYRPWLDEGDLQDVFFASSHGYGPRDRFADHITPQQGGWFYPASGKTMTSEAVRNPSYVERLNLSEFLLTQTWARMGDDARTNCCKIINVGLNLPRHHDVPGMQRIELRDSYRKNILPNLLAFNPDMIFISAGFDGHKRDTMNFGYCGMIEDDYEWLTEQLVKVANTCCQGRIVSVLEGGYKIHGGIVSPFARSVAAHVRALVEGGCSREVYSEADGMWESQYERQMVEEKERRRQMKLDKLRFMEMERRRTRGKPNAAPAAFEKAPETDAGLQSRSSTTMPSSAAPGIAVAAAGEERNHCPLEAMMKEPLHEGSAVPVDTTLNHPDTTASHNNRSPTHQDDEDQNLPRKRKRSAVDYKQLYEQMKKEGFTG